MSGHQQEMPMSDDTEKFSPIDHICRWCGHRLEGSDVDPDWVRCPNPNCQAETDGGGPRELCCCGGLDEDAPIHFQCVKNRRRTNSCPDEIIVIEKPRDASTTRGAGPTRSHRGSSDRR
jgi:hypothetical protein